MSSITLPILGVLVVLLLISFISGRISWVRLPNDKQVRREWWTTWWQGLSTEMASALITGVLLAMVFNHIQNVQNEENARIAQQEQLVFDMGSRNNEIALEAMRRLRALGGLLEGTLVAEDFSEADWTDAQLQDADLNNVILKRTTLIGADLSRANLTSANLEDANLTNADLTDANLSGTTLSNANLEEVDFHGANLTGANLQDVELSEFSLQGANLTNADLRGLTLSRLNLDDTILTGADLRGVSLLGVDLTGKDLTGATFDEATTLPDGNKWTPETDMTQFTGGES